MYTYLRRPNLFWPDRLKSHHSIQTGTTFLLQTNRQRDRALQTSELMALWLAWQESPAAIAELSNRLQIEKPAAKALLEGLAQAGLVQIRRQSYELIHQEHKPNGDAWQAILALLEKDGRVTRRSVMQVLNIGEKQAEYLLKTWVVRWKIESRGQRALGSLRL